MALQDPKQKRDGITLGQRIGATLGQAATGMRDLRDNVLFRPVRAIAGDDPLGSAGRNLADASASFSANRPVSAAPVRKPVVSPVDGRSMTGEVPASPALPKPDFSGVQGRLTAPASARATGIERTMINGVPTYTGTGPALVNPTIAPLSAPQVVNQSESTDQRRTREAAISEIGSQLFLNRGKNTRSSRDLTAGLLQTQADLTNTAGNQGVALKNANLDAQARLDITGMQNQGENDRAVVFQSGENQRASLLDAGATEREQIKLERPQLLTDRDGGYLLLNPAQGVAQPVLSNGQQVRGLVEGAITPVDRLVSLQEELKASQQSLVPDPVHIGRLERQIDSLRRPRPVVGDVIDGHRFRGGDPGIAANWERIGGAP